MAIEKTHGYTKDTPLFNEGSLEGLSSVTNGSSKKKAKRKTKASSPKEAVRKAKAKIGHAKKKTYKCIVTIPGDEFCVAGQNIMLADFGYRNGKWQVQTAIHTITKGGGYTTTLEICHGLHDPKANKIAEDPVFKSDLNNASNSPQAGAVVNNEAAGTLQVNLVKETLDSIYKSENPKLF